MSETTWTGVGGKQVLVTGGTNGIGLAAAKALAEKGAHVALVGREAARGQVALTAVREAAERAGRSVRTDLFLADLSLQAQVRRLADEVLDRLPSLQVLANNAGAVFSRRRITADGVEATWALNHLAPWLLTSLLLGRMRGSEQARVITTSSEAGARSHIPFDDIDASRSWGQSTSQVKGFRRYGQTKLANILFTIELAGRLEGTGVEVFSFHPGFVASNFNLGNGRLVQAAMALTRPFARTPEEGAQTLVWLADTPTPGQSGGYFADCRVRDFPPGARDAAVPARLWALSEQQVAGPQAPWSSSAGGS